MNQLNVAETVVIETVTSAISPQAARSSWKLTVFSELHQLALIWRNFFQLPLQG